MAKAGKAVAVLVAVSTLIFIGRAGAQTHAVTGQFGVLGEWELTAIVTKRSDGGGRLWSGPLSLTHIGFCSVDGPEEKTGKLSLDVPDLGSSSPGESTATLSIDGEVCTFKGHLTDGYDGVLVCPDRADVPMMLMIQ
jgi:hypothetical protein